MATPKGIRATHFRINETDAVHIFSDPAKIWLQLRRDHPTELDIGISSFKSALCISKDQAISIATELLAAAAQKNSQAPPHIPKPAESHNFQHPENHGKPWTPEEDKKLISRFSSGLPIEDIARKHKRGIGGIQSRLTKHGKLAPPVIDKK